MSRLIFHVELGSIDRYEQKSDTATFTFADVHRCCYLGIGRDRSGGGESTLESIAFTLGRHGDSSELTGFKDVLAGVVGRKGRNQEETEVVNRVGSDPIH